MVAVETCGGISAVGVGIGDTVRTGSLIGVRSHVHSMVSPTELTREGERTQDLFRKVGEECGKQDGGHNVIT
jgi:hypothetical protein